MAERVAFLQPSLPGSMPEEGPRQALAQDLLEEYGVVLLHGEALPQHSSGILLDPAGWLRPWKGFQGVILTADRIQGRGICLEPASAALEGCRLPEGIQPRDFLAAILKEDRILPGDMPCQGWQNGFILSWEELLHLAAESCQEG